MFLLKCWHVIYWRNIRKGLSQYSVASCNRANMASCWLGYCHFIQTFPLHAEAVPITHIWSMLDDIQMQATINCTHWADGENSIIYYLENIWIAVWDQYKTAHGGLWCSCQSLSSTSIALRLAPVDRPKISVWMLVSSMSKNCSMLATP